MLKIASWVALVVLAQEPQGVDHWIERLGDEDPITRDEAVRQLKGCGDEALEAVKKATKSSDDEVAARAKAIIEYLDRSRRARQILATGKPFSLVVPVEKQLPLKDLLSAVQSHFGVTIEIADELLSKTWCGKLDSLKLLQVMDRVCADAAAVYSVGIGRIRVSSGTPLARPCDYPGSYRVTLREVGMYVTNDFQKKSRQVSMLLDAVHQSGCIDVPAEAIRPATVEFDTGETVKVDLESGWRRPRERDVRILNVPAGVQGIRTIRGALVVKAPAVYEKCMLECGPDDVVGTTDRGNAMHARIERGSYEGLDYLAVLGSMEDPTLKQDFLKEMGDAGSITLLSMEGEEAPIPPEWLPRHSWTASGRTLSFDARFLLPKGKGFEPAKVVVKVPREFETVELPFEIRDVPLR